MEKSVINLSEKIEKSMKETDWDFGNQVLYKLCKKNPGHTEPDKIIAKVWLIGRAYAAAIERQTESSTDLLTYYKKVAEKLIKEDFDSELAKLKKINKIDDQTLLQILGVHFALDKRLKISGETEKSRRSFCSKYLHFHYPELFFIYDSMAYAALGCYKKIHDELFDNNAHKALKDAINKVNVDEGYANFFLDCYLLKNHINRKINKKFNCRHLDNMLLFQSEDVKENYKDIKAKKKASASK